MDYLSSDNPSRLFSDVYALIRSKGVKVANPKIREIGPVTLRFNPKGQLVIGSGFNPFLQRSILLWVLGGRADSDWLLKFDEQIRRKYESGYQLNHTYGERIRAEE